MLCGLLGYAAFGNKAPGNFLTGFGFYEPYWLVDIGNVFIVIHLVGAFQVTNLRVWFLYNIRIKYKMLCIIKYKLIGNYSRHDFKITHYRKGVKLLIECHKLISEIVVGIWL